MKKIFFLGMMAISTILSAQFNGELDSAFGKNGVMLHDYNQQEDFVIKAKFDQLGKIYMAGYTSTNSNPDILIMRMDANGNPDQAFGSQGQKSIEYLSNENDYLRDMDILPNGKIVLAGYVRDNQDSDALVAVLNPDGSHHGLFNQSGYKISGGAGDEIWTSCIALSNNKILLGGISSNGGDSNPVLTRLEQDGTVDQSFATSGVLSFDYAQEEVLVTLHQQSDNTFYGLIEQSSNKLRIMAFDSLGQMISSFGSNGTKLLSFPQAQGLTMSKLITDKQGYIYAIGTLQAQNFNHKVLVLRMKPNGDLDSNYAIDGVFEALIGTGVSNFARDARILTDGSLLVSGSTFSNNKAVAMSFVLATDGSLAFNHGPTGLQTYDYSDNMSSIGTYIMVDPHGLVYLYGSTQTTNQWDFAMYKLKGRIVSNIGLEEEDPKVALQAYPNPVQNHVELDLSNFEDDQIRVQITDLGGRVLLDREFDSTSVQLDLSSYPKGLYIVHASAERQYAELKLVKQ